MDADTDDNCYSNTFRSDSIHDVPNDVVERAKRYVRANLITGRTLPPREVSWFALQSAVSHLTKRQRWGTLEGDNRVDDVPPSTNDVGYMVVVDVNMEDDWDFWDTLHSGANDVRSSLLDDVLEIQEKCRSYSLYNPANAGGVFRSALLF